MDNKALIVVDVQNDFCRGGSLAVTDAEAILPVINEMIGRCVTAGHHVVATRDWHPPDHCSFDGHGGSWPVHCVAGTPGAAFHADLRLPADAVVVGKALDARTEAYSGFEGTDLAMQLRERGIAMLWVCGLATDYCVKQTVLDARRAGFEVAVVEEAIRGVDLEPEDSTRALARMREAGARSIRAAEVAPLLRGRSG